MEITDPTPMPMPTPTERMMFCKGKARETAVRACVPSLATHTLSMMLYRDWITMDKVTGMARDRRRGRTGFSFMASCLFSI